MSRQIVMLAVSALKPNPNNTTFYDDLKGKKYEQFKESIEYKGVMSPIRVASDMTIISGHQRWRASKDLGLLEIPAEIPEGFMTEDEQLEELLILNIQRAESNPVKEGLAIQEYERLKGVRQGSNNAKGVNQYSRIGEPNYSADQMSQEHIAAMLNMSVDTVQNRKKLAELYPDLRNIVQKGRINQTTVYSIISKLPEEEQIALFEKVSEFSSTKKFKQKEIQALIDEKQELLEKAIEENEKIVAECEKLKTDLSLAEKGEAEATKLNMESNDVEEHLKIKEDLKKEQLKYRNTFAQLEEKIKSYNDLAQQLKDERKDKQKEIEEAIKSALEIQKTNEEAETRKHNEGLSPEDVARKIGSQAQKDFDEFLMSIRGLNVDRCWITHSNTTRRATFAKQLGEIKSIAGYLTEDKDIMEAASCKAK